MEVTPQFLPNGAQIALSWRFVLYWPERILKLHLYTQVAVGPVLALHRHLKHPRITAAGGEGKDCEELEEEEEE